MPQKHIKDMEHTKERENTMEKTNHRNTKSKDGVFDLDKIPMEVFDRGWKDYAPYLDKLDKNHPLYQGNDDKLDDAEVGIDISKIDPEILRQAYRDLEKDPTGSSNE